MEKIKNINKIESEELKKSLIDWNENVSRITINDDGMYIMDLIPMPGFSGATLTNMDE